jgi:hypothetical protein
MRKSSRLKDRKELNINLLSSLRSFNPEFLACSKSRFFSHERYICFGFFLFQRDISTLILILLLRIIFKINSKKIISLIPKGVSRVNVEIWLMNQELKP